MNGENPRVSKTLCCRGECKALLQAPAPHNTCGSCWLGTARQFSHHMLREGGSGVTLICVPVTASRKRKTEQNLIFRYNFIQCSTEKLLFSVQHFCRNIRILICSHYGFTSFYGMWSPGNFKVPLTLRVKRMRIVRFEGLPQIKWSDLGEQDVVGQGSFGAVFMVFDSSG